MPCPEVTQKAETAMKTKLLIVETDPCFRLNLAQHMRGKPIRVLQAAGKADCRRILQRVDLDVVLLGLSGLRREGLELLRMVKKLQPNAEVITLNDSQLLWLSFEAMKLGAFDDFLIPFDMDALIRRILDAQRAKKKSQKAGTETGGLQ